MLGVSGLLGSASDDGAATTAAAATAHEEGGGGGGGEVGGGVASNSGMFGEEDKGRIEEGDRNSAGNRWPRQETMALLKIRSDMDVAFRDSSLKGPLWDEVSRKLAELGYHRSAKKCKEKFENVYKYHKRTKDGRSTKPDGKTYRFFDQLQALEHHSTSLPLPSPPSLPPKPQTPATTTAPMLGINIINPPTVVSQVTVPSTTNPTSAMSQNTLTPPQPNSTIPSPPTTNLMIPSQSTRNPAIPTQSSIPSSLPNVPANVLSNSTSSSTSSDEEFEGRNRKRKRKWKDFFGRLMKEVIEKQEDLQKKFLEAIEKREHDRMAREDAWKMQEMARMNREHEILVQERSISAAKDAAVIAFLQKISEQQIPVQVQVRGNSPAPHLQPPQTSQPQPQLQSQPQPLSQPQPQPHPLPPPPRPITKTLDIPKLDNGESTSLVTSPSRWPKAEVQALIQLRTSLDLKYQDSGPKGPLWEEISAGMRKLGYNRNAKRCKEKWENINKYFKKVKESNKQRPEDSKTCPYFHLLDALYKERNKNDSNTNSFNPSYVGSKPPENIDPMVPLMVQPEQQWPAPQNEQHRPDSDMGSENMDRNQEEEEEDEDDDGDDEEEDEGGGYEIVSNKPASMGTVE